MKPDDPELGGDGGRGLGGGHAGAVAQPEDVGEPDEDEVGRDHEDGNASTPTCCAAASPC